MSNSDGILDVWNHLVKRKLLLKIGCFEKSGVKLKRSTEEGKRLLVQVIPENPKNEGSENRNSPVVIVLKNHILLAYYFNQQPGKITNL